jgi:hypothetical protein
MNPHRPIDPALAAAAAGRVAAEHTTDPPARRRGRSARIRGPPSDDDDDVDAYSIPQFCRRHNISESFFHKLRSQGLGPATMEAGRRTLISKEAAREWRRQRTAATRASEPS